jgi:glyoxylase-like metal-dependent hydrolase (beta-lactamase superfamily II)
VIDQPQPISAGLERLSLRTPTLPPASETNSYFVSRGGEFYVVEPASPHRREQRILFERVRERAARGEKLLGAIVTHHHRDHIGSVREFRTEFGVPLFAHAITRTKLADYAPVDRVLEDGETLFDGTVAVLHTPGHAPGHICLWHATDRWLIAGDMVASVGTIIVDPDDDGDMAAYVHELARLAQLDPARILPAHGDPIDDAVARLEFYIRHRAEREAKVLAAIPAGETGADLLGIVQGAYADTSTLLWPLAMKSARAHLAKLVSEGALRVDGARWKRTR